MMAAVMHKNTAVAMKNKAPGILSIAAAIALLIMWFIYLFSAQPEGMAFELGLKQLMYSVNPSTEGYQLYIGTIISIIACIGCGLLLLLSSYKQLAFVVIAIHGAVALYFYDWSIAGLIALPLLFSRGEVKNA